MQIPIPDDWDGLSKCRFAVCWPDSPKWKAILFGLISSPSQGRFWDAATGYIKGVQAAFQPYYTENYQFKEVLMACGDTGLSEGLQAIAQAIVTASANSSSSSSAIASACCEQVIIQQQGGIQGTIPGTGDAPPTTFYGTENPQTVAPGTFPDGFDSLEEYQLDKCQVANLVVDGLEGTLHGLSTLGIFNAVALAGLIVAAIVGAIVFPPAVIGILGAAIGVLSVEITILEQVKNEIEANRQDWVCALYNSDAVEAALEAVNVLIEDIVATLELSSPIGFAVQTIIFALLNTNTLNQLFHKIAHLQYPDADCSSCNPLVRVWDMCAEELVTPNEDGSFTIASMPDCANSYGCDAVYFRIGVLEDGTFPETVITYKITATGTYPIGPIVCRSGGNWNYYDSHGAVLLADQNDQHTDQCTSYVFVMGDEPFSITFTYEAC